MVSSGSWNSYEEFSDYVRNEDLSSDLIDYEVQQFGRMGGLWLEEEPDFGHSFKAGSVTQQLRF